MNVHDVAKMTLGQKIEYISVEKTDGHDYLAEIGLSNGKVILLSEPTDDLLVGDESGGAEEVEGESGLKAQVYSLSSVFTYTSTVRARGI